ncbi:carotenoid biosynthesis protein [Vagococcus entomophilus]|uniref:carotenoid biosynthesis protein n=1 Tax=Vagococcus entomophilus TaxID=1160095 RepID=UPI0014752CCA|nr:carotenoid biosynthesis protein [Vagococcus entomophilus]
MTTSKIKSYLTPQWLLTFAILFLAVITGISSAGFFENKGAAILTLLSVIYVFIQGAKRYSWKSIIIFLCLAFVFGNLYENMSIATGFPFGNYYYTSSLGPKLIYTPIFINVAYFQMAYITWNLSSALLGSYSNKLKGTLIFIQPIIASFLMILWDIVIDPWSSTISHAWRWENGGAYFGVPFSNYLGWFLCVFSIFFSFAIYTYYFQKDEITDIVKTGNYWVQLIIIYNSWLVLIIIRALNTSILQKVFDLGGQYWLTKQLYEVGALFGLCSMVPLSLLCLFNFQKTK